MEVVAAFAAALVAGVAFWFWARRRQARGLVSAGAAVGVFCNSLIAILGAAHLTAVLVGAGRRLTAAGGEAFRYDFRFYSLVLLGVLLIGLSLAGLRAAPALARGEHAAWRRALSAALALLAVNLPLIPIQGFAELFTALCGIHLLGLAVIRRSGAFARNAT